MSSARHEEFARYSPGWMYNPAISGVEAMDESRRDPLDSWQNGPDGEGSRPRHGSGGAYRRTKVRASAEPVGAEPGARGPLQEPIECPSLLRFDSEHPSAPSVDATGTVPDEENSAASGGMSESRRYFSAVLDRYAARTASRVLVALDRIARVAAQHAARDPGYQSQGSAGRSPLDSIGVVLSDSRRTKGGAPWLPTARVWWAQVAWRPVTNRWRPARVRYAAWLRRTRSRCRHLIDRARYIPGQVQTVCSVYGWWARNNLAAWLAPDHRTTWRVAVTVLMSLQVLALLALWTGGMAERRMATEGQSPNAVPWNELSAGTLMATSGMTVLTAEPVQTMSSLVEPAAFAPPAPDAAVFSPLDTARTSADDPSQLLSEPLDSGPSLASRSDQRLRVLVGVPYSPQPGRTAAPNDGRLVVVSDPPGANVTVNGIGWGVTPLTVRYLPFGEKRVRVTKDGYRAAEQVTRLAQERPIVTVRIALAAQD